jgi:Flp pilus assembly protein TadB
METVYGGGRPTMDGDATMEMPNGEAVNHGTAEHSKKDRYGLNMRRWAARHEADIESRLAQGADPKSLLDWHVRKLQWLQHERLVHLIVLFITIVLFLVALAFVTLVPSTMPVSLVIYLILLVLLAFYLRHYFFLENTVQHWYRTAEELHERAENS